MHKKSNPIQPAAVKKGEHQPKSLPERRKRSFVILAAIAFIIGSVGLVLRYSPVRTSLKHSLAILASYNLFQQKVDIPTQLQAAPIDGMLMIHIPAGEFSMGTDAKEFQKSRPQRSVYLNGFWIDQTEVSNAMYARCVAAGACKAPIHSEKTNPAYGDPKHANDPVVYVRWTDAKTYCTWAGRRLPTEAEWEKAARGTDGRIYPWGNSLPTSSLLNYNNNVGGPLPVDRYPAGASPYGVLNMAGNVREWVADWYSAPYYRFAPLRNPAGPASGESKVLRGGSYLDGWREVRLVNRFDHAPGSPGINRGFRCAVSESMFSP